MEAINARVGYKSMSLFQSDVNITNVLQADYMDDLVQQVTKTKTDAIVYLTVYPFEGFGNVSDAAINQLAEKVANVTKTGTRMFIRYASEMNGIFMICDSLYLTTIIQVLGFNTDNNQQLFLHLGER